MKTHSLKIDVHFWNSICNGDKLCEVRRNDRDFQVGDKIYFNAVVPDGHEDVVNNLSADTYKISHVLSSDQFPSGIQRGYCVLSIKKVEPEAELETIK